MDSRAIRAGAGSALVGLIIGAALGTYGGWTPLLNLAGTTFGAWIITVALGVFLAYVYAFWFNAFLPGSTVIRGVLFGVLVWILALILGAATDFFKEAVYPSPAGPAVFLALVFHVIWGAVLGILYEAR